MTFRYVLVDQVGEVTGTNTAAVAKQAADGSGENGFLAVVDTQTGSELINDRSYPILRQTTFVE